MTTSGQLRIHASTTGGPAQRGRWPASRGRRVITVAADVVLQVDAAGVVEWASPSVKPSFGWEPVELIGTPVRELGYEGCVVGWDPAGLLAASDAAVPSEVKLRVAGNSFRWCSARVHTLAGPSGPAAGFSVTLSDIHVEVTRRRALAALSTGRSIVERAETELQLLDDMCRAIVDSCGFLFSWYGRPLDAPGHLVDKTASSSEHRDYLNVIEVSWGDDPLGLGPTGTALHTGRSVIAEDLASTPGFAPWIEAARSHGFRSSIAVPVVVDDGVDGALSVYAGEADAFDPLATGILEELAAQLGHGLRRIRDAGRLRQAEGDRDLLVTAVEQASEAIVITDVTPSILYANPAATVSSGYSSDELVGRNPSLLKSGIQDDAFYRDMWSQLLQGLPWDGVLVNMAKSGELYEEDASITPVRDPEGAVVAYVAVKTDLTRERTLEARLQGQHRRHSSVLELMKSVRTAPTLEATIAGFCEALSQVDDMDAVRVLLLDPQGGMAPVGITGPTGSAWDIGVPLELTNLGQLLDQTRVGAWWFDLRTPGGRQGFSPGLTATLVEAGFTSAALAPVRWEGRMVAVVAVATRSTELGEWTSSRLETLEEIGSYAGTLFGAQIAHHTDREQTRVTLHEIVEEHRFHPVFQPIVELRTGTVVAYEALTRFDDGRRPDLRFADAHAVGMGPELELVTAVAAITAAEWLPDGMGLSINLSPAAILEGIAARLVQSTGRIITIEITEHAEVENYPAVRRALSAVDGLRVSIDDAGAGFASLRHILELQPDVVKLDIGIVRGIDADPARQALAAGLAHFSALTGTVLIAEGVETDAEAEALRGLDIEWAQGYLFGRPEPLPVD